MMIYSLIAQAMNLLMIIASATTDYVRDNDPN